MAGEPRARRLVQRPVAGGGRRVRAGGCRVERAILALGDVGRVHLYRWGDGGAHFHVWFMPRPLGMLEASGMMLPLWEDVLPNVTDEELADAAKADRRGAVTAQAALARRLGTFDAVVIGLGSMIGAGVFAAFAPRPRRPAAGCSSAWRSPGRRLLQRGRLRPARGPVPDLGRNLHLRAGAARRVVGFPGRLGVRDRQDGICAAMALTFAAYAVPGPRLVERPVAASPRARLTAVNLRGITRTAGLTRILVAMSLAALAIVVGVILGSGEPARQLALGAAARAVRGAAVGGVALLRVRRLRADRDARRGGSRPARTIPRAIPLALGIAVASTPSSPRRCCSVLGPDDARRRASRRS